MDRHQMTVDPPFGTYILPDGLDDLPKISARTPDLGVRDSAGEMLSLRRYDPCGMIRPEAVQVKERIISQTTDTCVNVDVSAGVKSCNPLNSALSGTDRLYVHMLVMKPDPGDAGGPNAGALARLRSATERAPHDPFAVGEREIKVGHPSNQAGNPRAIEMDQDAGAKTVQAKPPFDIPSCATEVRIRTRKIGEDVHEIPMLIRPLARAPAALRPSTPIAEMVHSKDGLPRLLKRNNDVLTQRADTGPIVTRQPATDA